MRRIVIGGFASFAAACAVGVIKDLRLHHWGLAGRESLAVVFCLAMIPVGVTALKVWSRALDVVIPDGK